MDILIKAGQLIAALSILVFVHELGHFFFARLFKIRVEKFYLFFDIKFALFKFKPKNSETEYGIGWLPLGGYCKIAGMIDESMDKEALKSEPKPWEFRSKPAWQRLLILFGGVLFNFILAIIVYAGSLMTWGEQYVRNEDATYGIYANSLAREIGFRHGDRIVSFGELEPEIFTQLQIDLVREQAEYARVIRDGDTVTINIDKAFIPAILKTPGMFEFSIPFQVKEIPDTSINRDSGLMPGDIITGIDGKDIKGGFLEVTDILKSSAGRTIDVTVARGTDTTDSKVTVDETGKMEVILENDITKFIKVTEKKYGFAEAITGGAGKAVKTLTNYFKELKLMVSPETEAYKSVGSFITMGSLFPSSWNWSIFWSITAFLSVMLAVLNILPIPALDGGHILFILYEMISGRKPSDKFMEYAQMFGMLILIGLMILAFGNDIFRLFN